MAAIQSKAKKNVPASKAVTGKKDAKPLQSSAKKSKKVAPKRVADEEDEGLEHRLAREGDAGHEERPRQPEDNCDRHRAESDEQGVGEGGDQVLVLEQPLVPFEGEAVYAHDRLGRAEREHQNDEEGEIQEKIDEAAVGLEAQSPLARPIH